MATQTPSLLEVIEALKAIYSPEDRENLSISYSGTKVEYEGEIWYEITTADGSGSYTAFCSILDSEFVNYDGDHLDGDDRIPEIEEIIAKRFAE
ncbi:hypothetical protein SEA_MORTYSMITH_57 [Microbacterium phage MortySmith]